MEKILRSTLRSGVFLNVSASRSRMMSKIRGKHNHTTEAALRMALVRSGVRGWEMHPTPIQGRPDFVFRRKRLVVFVDGCFWHGCPMCGHIPRTRSSFWGLKISRNRRRDRTTSDVLRAAGWIVLRFWEHQLRKRIDEVVEKIQSTLAKRDEHRL